MDGVEIAVPIYSGRSEACDFSVNDSTLLTCMDEEANSDFVPLIDASSGSSPGRARSNVSGHAGGIKDGGSSKRSLSSAGSDSNVYKDTDGGGTSALRRADRTGGGAFDDFGGLNLIVIALPVREAELRREPNFFGLVGGLFSSR